MRRLSVMLQSFGGGGTVGSSGGKDVTGSKDAKRRRCKASINNKLAICHPELVSGAQEKQQHGGQSDVQDNTEVNPMFKRS